MRTEFIHLPRAGATVCLGYIEPINAIGISFAFAKNFVSRDFPRDGFNRRIGRDVSLGRLAKAFRRGQITGETVFLAPTTDDFQFLQFARELRDLLNNIVDEQLLGTRSNFITLVTYTFTHHLGDPKPNVFEYLRLRLMRVEKDVLPS